MKPPLVRQLDRLATERWARRGVRALVRAVWLGLCVCCIGLGGNLLWGWGVRVNVLGALALAIVGVAVLLLLVPRLTPRAAARRLDRRFHLDEQLATAVEVAERNPPPGSIAARLVAESSHTAELLSRRLARRPALPWQDLLTLAALALVALGLWIISGASAPSLAGVPLPLPGLAAPVDPAQQFPQEQQGNGDTGLPSSEPGGQAGDSGQAAEAGSQPSAADPQVLQALADALRDQGVTRPAANALDRGDAAGAARELRALADQASQLSQETRDQLASRLRDAADRIEGRDTALADQLRQSARDLEEGGQRAAQALDDLARAIEQRQGAQPLGAGDQAGPGQQSQSGQAQGQGQGQGQDQGQGQGQGQGGQSSGAGSGPAGEQRQSDPTDRLGVEGQAVPLEANGEGEVPVPQSGQQQPGAGSNQPGFTQGGSGGGGRVQIGADPLRVPIDERDVVQEYFQH